MPNQKGIVTVTVKTFRQMATTLEPKRYCAVDLEMPALPIPPGSQQPDIVFKRPAPGSNKNGKFHFNARSSLELNLVPREGVSAVYIPLAVAFRRSQDCVDHPECDMLGRKILSAKPIVIPPPAGSPPGTKPSHRIVIENEFNHGGDMVYEFYILVQREADGALGIIDPDIENKEDPT